MERNRTFKRTQEVITDQMNVIINFRILATKMKTINFKNKESNR